MYYILIHRRPGQALYCEVYTTKGKAEADLKKHNEYGLVITCNNPSFKNYGLVNDLIDHIDEL